MFLRNTLIVGAGRSGLRFLRAALIAKPTTGGVRVRAIVDENPDRLTCVQGNSIVCVNQLPNALDVCPFDVIVLCVNESRHHVVFEDLAAHGVATSRIVSEKPLTETLAQAEIVNRKFRDIPIAVNFVERASGVVAAFKNWLHEHDHVMKRVTFFWGKNRIGDKRPTIGVISELSHPIDLVLYLAGLPPGTSYRVLSAQGLSSRLGTATAVYDTLHVGLVFQGDLLVDGSSSYTWASRDRRLLVFSGPCNGPATHLSVLTFDQPIWDLDSLHIFDLAGDSGRMIEVHHLRIGSLDIVPERLTVHKVTRFLETVVDEIDGVPSGTVADLAQGMYVQRILHDIHMAAARTDGQWQHAFLDRAPSKETAIHHTERAIRKMLLGEPLQHSDYVWDDGY